MFRPNLAFNIQIKNALKNFNGLFIHIGHGYLLSQRQFGNNLVNDLVNIICLEALFHFTALILCVSRSFLCNAPIIIAEASSSLLTGVFDIDRHDSINSTFPDHRPIFLNFSHTNPAPDLPGVQTILSSVIIKIMFFKRKLDN